jgi:FtsP/CotA-like multicopper oxidase with cupredoxin domain
MKNSWPKLALLALLVINYSSCTSPEEIASPSPGKHRIYYIAAVEKDWNYVPAGQNLVYGRSFNQDEETYVKTSASTIGSVYKKALYVEYTDSTFTAIKARTSEEQYLGLLGPAIRAEVGDTIDIFYFNNTTVPTSMHPHGVSYLKSSEGSPTNDSTDGAGASIAPGGRYHYIWMVPERSGPGPNDPSSILWGYHSHVTEAGDVFSGLMGPIIITRQGKAKSDAHPKDVDKEFIVLFMVIDENQSLYLNDNRKRFIPDSASIDPGVFEEGNLKHAMNGFLFGNMPMPEMKVGERVRWYLFSFGNEVDIHTAHWHGNTAIENGTRQDVINLFPATFRQADMVPDQAGIWLFHCHVTDHMMAGMMERYRVFP